MKKKDKRIDPLPDTFSTAEEAGAFWDTHSTMDYLEFLEPVNDVIQIQDRVFEIQVAADVYARLQQQAKKTHESVPRVVDHILRTSLAKT